MNFEHNQIVEYGAVTRKQISRAVEVEPEQYGVTFKRIGIGFECAGSMARFQGKEVFAVNFYINGATHGKRFLIENEAEARAYHARLVAHEKERAERIAAMIAAQEIERAQGKREAVKFTRRSARSRAKRSR